MEGREGRREDTAAAAGVTCDGGYKAIQLEMLAVASLISGGKINAKMWHTVGGDREEKEERREEGGEKRRREEK